MKGAAVPAVLVSKSGMAKSRRLAKPGGTLGKCSKYVATMPQCPDTPSAVQTHTKHTAKGEPLHRGFFDRSVHEVAPELIGAKLLVSGVGGRIVEVEAYHQTEPAAHSYRGRTDRNAVMFGPAGYAYVYRSYGMHWCLNFVCEAEGQAGAVLIRALEPVIGFATMRRRRGLSDVRLLCAGPGRVCEALGVTRDYNGFALDQPPFAVFARTSRPDIVVGSRIGITKAADLPWRYGLKGSKFLSKPFKETVTQTPAGTAPPA